MLNCQRQILEQKIQLLEIQIQEQKKREEMFRREREILIERLSKIDEIEEEANYLKQQNQFLQKTMYDMKERYQQETTYSNNQISKLKAQINEKIKDEERIRIEGEKRTLKYQQKISMLEEMIEKKCAKIAQLQTKLHQSDIRILKQNSQLVVSRFGSCETENNMGASNVSSVSRKSQVKEYMKMDKTQMKILMGAIKKSKRQLEKGKNDIEMQTTKRNRTFYN